jgi:hypothetical protein
MTENQATKTKLEFNKAAITVFYGVTDKQAVAYTVTVAFIALV